MRLRQGKLVSEWKDNYRNRALIEEVEVKPCKEAKTEKVYRLSCYAEYDNDFCYYISIFDSIKGAEHQLEEFSCGSFKNELITRAKNIIYALKSEYGNFIDMNKNDIEKIIDRTKIVVNRSPVHSGSICNFLSCSLKLTFTKK